MSIVGTKVLKNMKKNICVGGKYGNLMCCCKMSSVWLGKAVVKIYSQKDKKNACKGVGGVEGEKQQQIIHRKLFNKKI